MNPISASPRIRAWMRSMLLVWCALATSLHGQYEVKSGAYNRLSAVPIHYTPVGPNLPSTGDPTITPQFANWVETSASSGPVGSGYPASSNTGIKLTYSSTGTTFASGVPATSMATALPRPCPLSPSTEPPRIPVPPVSGAPNRSVPRKFCRIHLATLPRIIGPANPRRSLPCPPAPLFPIITVPMPARFSPAPPARSR